MFGSNEIVNSNMVISFFSLLITTKSGRSVVGRILRGIVLALWPGRSTLTCMLPSRTDSHELIICQIWFKILSCLHVYLPWVSIVLHPFKMWCRVCLLLQRLHLPDCRFPHLCKFLKVGKASIEARTAKLRTLRGKLYMMLFHVRSSSCWDSNCRNWPWTTRLPTSCSHFLFLSSWMISLTPFFITFQLLSVIVPETSSTTMAASMLPYDFLE